VGVYINYNTPNSTGTHNDILPSDINTDPICQQPVSNEQKQRQSSDDILAIDTSSNCCECCINCCESCSNCCKSCSNCYESCADCCESYRDCWKCFLSCCRALLFCIECLGSCDGCDDFD